MLKEPGDPATEVFDAVSLAGVSSVGELGALLRRLRRRWARQRGEAELTYRELAARTGWAHGAVGHYLSGRGIPPTDRFDVLIRLLGATPAEQGVLATVRDRVAELRRVGSAGAGPARLGVPRQLPADLAGFAGRVAALTALDSLLDRRATQTAVVISVVSGTAGVGKTALAVHWAHRVAGWFPDGQLYVNLRGFDPGGQPVGPGEALRGFLDALAVPASRVPADLDGQVALYRSLLADRHMLVVLDNAAGVEQVRPLLPGAAGCLVVVTSRHQLAGLIAAQAAKPLPLDVLTVAEARLLLSHRLGAARIAAEPRAADELADACARLPLALAIVAARAATRPGFALGDLLAELRGRPARLDVLRAGDAGTDVRTVFSWSYQKLSLAAGRLFRLLGLHPGPSVAVPAAASLAALPAELVRPLLTELADAHLLAEPAPERYAFHDLLRAYAADLAHRVDPDVDRRAARHRTLDHYLHTAYRATMVLEPDQFPFDLSDPKPGVTPEHTADREAATDWFTAERAVLLGAVGHAADAGFDTHAWQLATAIKVYLDRQGQWHDWIAVTTTALAAAQRLGDPLAQAGIHRNLAVAHLMLGREGDTRTEAHLRRALDLYAELGDEPGQGRTEHNFAVLRSEQGHYREALDHAQRAITFARAADDRAGQAHALNSLGWFHAHLGELQQAMTSCRQGLVLFEEIGHRYGAAETWDSLGYVYHQLGRHSQAVDAYSRAIAGFRHLGTRLPEAESLDRLGDAHQSADNLDAARDAWRRSAAMYDELGHADAHRLHAKLRTGQVD